MDQWVEDRRGKRGKNRGDRAVAAVVADDICPGSVKPEMVRLGRCASVLDDLGQARDMRLAGNAEA